MGFTSVYKALLEVFPQIDSRILRAVAIEHSKDADVAVEVVFAEVIPHLSEQLLASSHKAESLIGLSEDGGKTVLHKTTMNPVDVISSFSRLLTKAGPSNTDGRLPGATEDAGSSDQTNHPTVVEPIASGSLGISSNCDAIGETDTVSDGETDTVSDGETDNVSDGETDTVSDVLPTPLEKFGDIGSINFDSGSPASNCERDSHNSNDNKCVEIGGDNIATLGDSVVTDAGFSEEEVTLQLGVTTPAAKDKYHNLDADTDIIIAPANSQIVGICETNLAVTQESDLNISSKTTSEKDVSVVELVNSEDEFTMTSSLNRSACSTELLDDIIEDARNSKKTLVSTMDSVVNLMKEVEFKEKAADQAKLEAARGCTDILEKVDELKEALRRAKEANDMHAGEVYAEKAILATELKELQLRLFTLSDERDLSLGILDEMRRDLEIRLATALEEIKAAEEEKMQKEESAREALAYQESRMEKVVEESKKLKLEAEENSKLQDFLMDRGRAIDILQGEISVKCQDVRLLKEKFDKRIPLSRSLSSSQTSSILASSGSSFQSTITPSEPEPNPDHELEPETYGTPKASAEVADSYGFIEKSTMPGVAVSPKSVKETIYLIDDGFPLSGDEKQEKRDDDRKLHLDDDDWELFDKDDLRIDG